MGEERRERYKMEDLNNSLKIEVNRYKELNNGLLAKNEHIITGLLSKSGDSKERFKEVEGVLGELNKQLEIVKNVRVEQTALSRNTVSLESYEGLLQEKTQAEAEVVRLR